MASEAIDFANLALSRLSQQYRDKPKFVQLVQDLSGLVQSEIDDPIENFITLFDIDKAEGHNLDVIGEIVGQPRVIVDYSLFEFFGYDGSTGSGTYGDLNDANTGARYLSSGEDIGGDKTLSDSEYRVFIRARILKNYSKSTPEEIIESTKLILGVDLVSLDEGVMEIDLTVSPLASNNDLSMVQNYDILPRPTGVNIVSVSNVTDSLTVSGTGTAADDSYTNYGFEFSRPIYQDSTPNNNMYWADGSWYILNFALPEIWKIDGNDIQPPKTGWPIGSILGSPAPTISY